MAGIPSAESLSSLGGSPRLFHRLRDLLYCRNSCCLPFSMVLHYLVGCSESLARTDYRALHPCHRLAPNPSGSGNSLRHSGNSSFILPAPSALGRKILFFYLVEPAEGFLCSCTSLCWFSSCLAFLCFPPHWFRPVAGVRLGPYHRVLGVQFRSSCLIACLRVEGICLSHDEVKHTVGLFYSFVSAIASTPCCFLYLTTNT